MKNKALILKNISKQYTLHHKKPTLAESLFNFSKKEKIWALKDINITINKGDKLGIVGDNGAGKTTLLKIITGITHQTKGKLQVNGKVAALIDLEAGFHPELTGIENIFFNGMLLGMSKEQIQGNLDSIISFSGLNKFIDVPLNTYSSGMKLRLGFSIAINSNPDILLIDDLIAVGDQDFKKKCLHALKKFFTKKTTIIYVTHYLKAIETVCEKCLWLENGKLKKLGKTSKIIKAYKWK